MILQVLFILFDKELPLKGRGRGGKIKIIHNSIRLENFMRPTWESALEITRKVPEIQRLCLMVLVRLLE